MSEFQWMSCVCIRHRMLFIRYEEPLLCRIDRILFVVVADPHTNEMRVSIIFHKETFSASYPRR